MKRKAGEERGGEKKGAGDEPFCHDLLKLLVTPPPHCETPPVLTVASLCFTLPSLSARNPPVVPPPTLPLHPPPLQAC